MQITASAAAYAYEFKLPTTSSIANSLSVADSSLSGPLLQNGQEEFRFKIPRHAPTGALQVTVGALIRGVGRAVTVLTIPVVH